MADEQETRSEVLSPLQTYIAEVAEYGRVFKEWEGRAQRIIKRYTANEPQDDNRLYSQTKYNILWSNVQTLSAATFAKLPKPDVTRRFGDHDPAGRVAALLLERALSYEIEEYPDYGATLRSVVLDRFLGGRGTAWARYEPHMQAGEQLPVDGLEVTEDIDEPHEELDYECSPVDYVHWKDFGHSIARTWEEVTAVWRLVYMPEDAAKQRFAQWYEDNPGKSIPFEGKKDKDGKEEEGSAKVARIYERWDKTTKKACWWNKTAGLLDEKDDPLGLTDFFPCPRPLYATLTNESLIPTPDFALYQDQAKALDVLASRQQNLIQALRVAGVYDAGTPELQRIFTETEDNTLIPVNNWQNFAEKNGIKGTMELVDLSPIAQALRDTYEAAGFIQNQVYEITGISDIIRGQSVASETATAQQLKGQYASLRLKAYQDDVARFATDLLRLKAQIICGKFSPQTILAVAAADQLSPEDRQAIGPAVQLLLGDRAMNPEAESPNPVRSFRIDVAADTLVYIDEQQEKQDRIEFMGAASQFLQQFTAAVAQMPPIAALSGELLKFGIGGFRQARTLEGVFDTTIEQMEQQAQQPKPDPEAQKMQAEQQKQQAEMQMRAQEAQQTAQLEQQKQDREMQIAQMQAALDAQLERERMAMEQQREQDKLHFNAQLEEMKAQISAALEIHKANINADTQREVAAMPEGE